MTELEIERAAQEARDSGLYPVATLKIFDTIERLSLSDKVKGHIEYTNELLDEHLELINNLKGETPGLKEYLKALRVGDIIDNHSMEKENSFLIGLYQQFTNENAIDRLIKVINNKKNITKDELLEIHNLLLYGTSSEGMELLRTNNRRIVGSFANGERIIDYFPIDYKAAAEAAEKLTKLFNSKELYEKYKNVFIEPFIIHGLFGALQIFSDGNTRMGRLVQHVLMWENINNEKDCDFLEPPLYATRCYYPYRNEYRAKMSDLVKYNNEEVWNNWFDFNLKRIEDQIYKSNENVHILKNRRK